MSAELEAARAEKRPRQDSSVVERLNVGGVHLDTSKDTLSQLPYFAALYEQTEVLGRKLSVDASTGRVFVDRNGELLKVIIDYLRTMLRPSQRLLDECERELRAEAEFYGCEVLLNELDGETSWYKLEQEDQDIKTEEEGIVQHYAAGNSSFWAYSSSFPITSSEYLCDVFANLSEFVTKPRKDLHYPLLFDESASSERSTGCNSVIPTTIKEFETRLQSIVGDWWPLLKDPAVVIAGGSVVAALVEEDKKATTKRDVDVFFCGVTPERADELVDALMKSVLDRQENLGVVHADVIRSKAALSISLTQNGTTALMPPLQIMLTLYKDPLEVVVNFDVDCCAVLYQPASQKVLCTPRCQRALNHRANVLDTAFRGAHYEARLEKYAARGFSVAVPGLDLSQVDQRLFKQEYLMLSNGVLLRMGEVRSTEKKDGLLECEVRRNRVNVGGRTWDERLREGSAILTLPKREDDEDEDIVRTASVQAAVLVPHSLERLLVLDQMRVPEVNIRHIRFDEENPSCWRLHFPVRAASGLRKTAAVNWTEFYVESSVGSDVFKFFAQLELERMMDEGLPSNSQLLAARRLPQTTLDWVAVRRLAAGKQLGFVYHRCDLTGNQPRVDLGRVRSAAQPPLATDLDAQQFEAKYGVEPELTFSPLTAKDYRAQGRLAVNLKLRSERPRRPFLTNVYSFSP